MIRLLKWLVSIVILLALLLVGVALALQQWVGSEDFRGRLGRQISASLGVPVEVGRIVVDVWPLPAVALEHIRVATQPPLTLQRIEARPVWAALLQRRLEIATLIVRDAVVPEQAVAAIAAVLQKSPRPGGASPPIGTADTISLVPKRTVLDGVTWVDAKGNATTVEAHAEMGNDGLPATAQVKVRKGRFEGAKAVVQREAAHWTVRADIGGGTVTGKIQLQPAGKAGSKLQGQFDTAGVEVAALTAPNRTLTGKLEAQTSLSAEFRDPGAIADALQTQTRFTVRNAVVHGIDLAQAVKAAGMSSGGETRLDTLTGNVATQGKAAQLNNLVAKSGALSANGNVALAPNRTLSGRINVDLASGAAGGTIGVPLVVAGTLDAPSVQLSQGALIGAAIGTAVAPGVGTGAGAKLGDKLGRLFGK